MSAGAPARGPWFAPLVLVTVGALAAWRLSAPVPSGAGAARFSDPQVLLGVFDALWVGLAALPSRTARGAGWAALVVAALGLPFHLAIAGAAGATPGHLAAVVLLVAAFAAAGWSGASGRRTAYGAGLAVVALGLPLSAYALEELLGVPVRWMLAAAPSTGPVLLGRTATSAAVTGAIPGIAAALLLIGISRWPGRSAEATA